MPKVDFRHPEYTKHKEQWQRCRHCASGGDAVKEAGEAYLPRLPEQTRDEYAAYVKRALYYNATARSIAALLGAIFRKDPVVQGMDDAQVEEISDEGFDILAQTFSETQLTYGRHGILVEVDKAGGTPYLVGYAAEDIVNWQVINSVLIQVVLFERYRIADKDRDEFAHTFGDQYRVLDLDNGRYRQRLFRKPEDQDEWRQEGPSMYPQRTGKALDFIPFTVANTSRLGVQYVQEPPLIDLVDVNLSHYRSAADLEHGAHFSALPTAWVAGFPAETQLRVGSTTAWMTSEPNARARYLEFTGKGLGTIIEIMNRKELKMAVLGARMLEEQKREAETAETWRVRLAGETGALSALANTASAALTQALRWRAWWLNWDPADIEKIRCELNTDFISSRMQPAELIALMQARQSGAISEETFLYNLSRGELLPPGVTPEEEAERIDLNPMSFSNLEDDDEAA